MPSEAMLSPGVLGRRAYGFDWMLPLWRESTVEDADWTERAVGDADWTERAVGDADWTERRIQR